MCYPLRLMLLVVAARATRLRSTLTSSRTRTIHLRTDLASELELTGHPLGRVTPPENCFTAHETTCPHRSVDFTGTIPPQGHFQGQSTGSRSIRSDRRTNSPNKNSAEGGGDAPPPCPCNLAPASGTTT